METRGNLTTINEEIVTQDDLLLEPVFNLPQQIPEPVEEEIPSGPDTDSVFDRRYREPFSGLLYLGKLNSTENILGHSFYIETPSQNERLESGVFHKKYLNSLSSEIAWAAIVVATYLKSVDGTPLPQPIGPNDTGLISRFNWVVNNLHGEVIQRVFEKCLILDAKVVDAMKELERLGES